MIDKFLQLSSCLNIAVQALIRTHTWHVNLTIPPRRDTSGMTETYAMTNAGAFVGGYQIITGSPVQRDDQGSGFRCMLSSSRSQAATSTPKHGSNQAPLTSTAPSSSDVLNRISCLRFVLKHFSQASH